MDPNEIHQLRYRIATGDTDISHQAPEIISRLLDEIERLESELKSRLITRQIGNGPLEILVESPRSMRWVAVDTRQFP